MRGPIVTLIAGTLLFLSQPAWSQDALAQLKALEGEWVADLPGFGAIANSLHRISNGTAISESIGVPDDTETSIYRMEGEKIMLDHYCALTPGGHIAHMTGKAQGAHDIDFVLTRTTNLASLKVPHMKHMHLTFVDTDHFVERWTKVENGKKIVFALNFHRK